MREPSGIVGIKTIARELGISIGTVDRAIHDRPGVSAETRARVLAMAERLGYKPNLAAQVLKLNRRLRIAAVLPEHISHFFDPVRAGIQSAADAIVGLQVTLSFHHYPRLGEGDIDTLKALVDRSYDGIIFLPGDPRAFDPLIHSFNANGTSMMCVGSDAPTSARIGSVAAHASISGSIAAELLAHKLPTPSSVAIFAGDLRTLDHGEKLRGFSTTLAAQAPHLKLLTPLESHEQPREAYNQAIELMRGADRPTAVYLSTANSVPVLEALDELNLLGETQIITTDLFTELAPLLDTGKVLATLYQRPHTQGRIAFENLIAHLIRKPFEPIVRLAPHIVFRSNLPLFTADISSTSDEK